MPEVRANRTDYEQFVLPYITCYCLDHDEENAISKNAEDLGFVFTKYGKGIDLNDTIAYRLVFGTPTYMTNINHTTCFKKILFKHHLDIGLALSSVDEELTAKANIPLKNSLSSPEGNASSGSSESIAHPAAPMVSIPHRLSSAFLMLTNNPAIANQPLAHDHQNHGTWFSKLKKPIVTRKNAKYIARKRENIQLKTLITVFDCHLKEDCGRLPSYFDFNVITNLAHGNKAKVKEKDVLAMLVTVKEPQPQLCPCYFKFRRQMDMVFRVYSQTVETFDDLPSIPPPEYVESLY